MTYSNEGRKAMAELQADKFVVYAKKDRIGVFPTWEQAWIYLNIQRAKGILEGPFEIVEALADIMPKEEDMVTIKIHIQHLPDIE